MENLISLAITPEIYQSLGAIKQDFEIRAQEALSVVCTAETVKDVKQVRSDIRKTKESLETQRKSLKAAYMKPYEDFLAVYNDATSSLDQADQELKRRIDMVTSELAEKRVEKLKTFFQEKAEELGVTWVTWESWETGGGKVIASKKDKYYKETLADFLENVVRDMAVIDNLPNKELVTSFFQQHYILSRAMSEATEQERQLEMAQQRMGQAMDQLQQDRMREAENQALLAAAESQTGIAEPVVMEEMPDKKFTMTFTIQNASMAQLKALKEFLIQGGYEYE